MTIPRDLSNLAPGANTSGVLQPTKGGTGLTSPGTNGNVLTSNGTAWVSSAPSSAGSGGATASGNVTLTSSSSGAQSITTTAFGQYVALPDATTMSKAANLFNIENVGPYPLRVKNSTGSTLGFIYPQEATMVGLSDNSTAAGVWNLSNIDPIAQTASYYSTSLYNLTKIREVRVDSDRLLFTYGNSTTNLYAQLYNETTQTWGTPTLVRSSAGFQIAIITGANQALICSCDSATSFEAVVLTFSGTTITVGTATTATNSGNFGTASFWGLVSVGSSYVVSYPITGAGNYCRAMTISGTTVSIGNEQIQSGTTTSSGQIVSVSSSVFFVSSITSGSTLYVNTYSVSGTTITTGSTASVPISASETSYRFLPISNGVRWAFTYLAASATYYVSILSISGTTPSFSTTDTTISGSVTAISTTVDIIVSSSKLIFVNCLAGQVNIVTDTGGTASAGTALSIPMFTNTCAAASVSSNIANIISINSSAPTNVARTSVDISGASPASVLNFETIPCTATYAYGSLSSAFYNSNYTDRKRTSFFYGSVNYLFFGTAAQIGEVMAIQGTHMYKAITRARNPLSSTGANTCVSVSANEQSIYNSNLVNLSAYGGVSRYESIT